MSRQINLICIGKTKPNSPEYNLYQKYECRCRTPINLIELPESRLQNASQAMAFEANQLRAKLSKSAFVICLDERGEDITSPDLARTLDKIYDNTLQPTFIIGGSHGIDQTLRAESQMSIRFGRVVWPHLLIRSMLAEQLYRCQSIIDGHPYHRL